MQDSTLTGQSHSSSRTIHCLRWVGTALLLLAVTDFLVKGVVDILPAYRYVIALLLGALLALCGLLSGYRWGDASGARWFFGLALACVPVQFSQVGAMLLELQLPWAVPNSGADPYSMDGNVLTLGCFFLSTAISWAISRIALRLLARSQAGRLGYMLFWGCVVLLMPIRTAPAVPLLLMSLYVYNSVQVVRHLRHDALLYSLDGKVAHVASWLPFMILCGRSLFYAVGPLEFAVPAGVISALCLTNAPLLAGCALWRRLCFHAGLAAAGIAWLMVGLATVERYSLTGTTVTYLVALPIAAIWYGLAYRLPEQAYRTRRLASFLVAITVVSPLCHGLDFSHAAVALFSGIVLSMLAIHQQDRWALVFGLVSGLSGLLHYLSGLRHLYAASPWLAMAVAGIMTLLLASYLDAQGASLRQRGQLAWQTWRSWG